MGVGWPKIMPLSGPSCKLRLSRSSARLRFQDRPSVAIINRKSVNYFDNQLIDILVMGYQVTGCHFPAGLRV